MSNGESGSVDVLFFLAMWTYISERYVTDHHPYE
jgi:hypothetical protein